MIKARLGVILASGGFEHNEQMRVKYQRAPITTEWTVGAKASLWRDEYDLDVVVAKAEVGE